MDTKPKTAYIVATCDTKLAEASYVRDCIAATGIPTKLVDVGIKSTATEVDVDVSQVAAHHPNGPGHAFGDDRGKAIIGMAEALKAFMSKQTDVAGMVGLGGSGGTGIITPAMQTLAIGIPKVMASTLASGDVSAYVGATDIMMLYTVTDVAGLNRISRKVLANAAHALAGMIANQITLPESDKASIGLSMFGVTTPCVEQLVAAYQEHYECLVFHATGTGGRSMERLADSNEFVGLLDVTTTEIADLIVGGVFSAGDDRMAAAARANIPYVGSVGACDMVNFWALDSVPEKFKDRNLYQHNAQVTLMRTTVDENIQIGKFIAEKLNAHTGQVRFLLPEKGVSAIDQQGQVFYDPLADKALFETIEQHTQQTNDRRVERVNAHINDAEFVQSLKQAFDDVIALTSQKDESA